MRFLLSDLNRFLITEECKRRQVITKLTFIDIRMQMNISRCLNTIQMLMIVQEFMECRDKRRDAKQDEEGQA